MRISSQHKYTTYHRQLPQAAFIYTYYDDRAMLVQLAVTGRAKGATLRRLPSVAIN